MPALLVRAFILLLLSTSTSFPMSAFAQDTDADTADTQPSRLPIRPQLEPEEYQKQIAWLKEVYSKPPDQWPKPTVDAQVKWKELGNMPVRDVLKDLRDPKIILGQRLFFDPRLSSTRQMACASCHDPELAWADGKSNSFGHNRQPLARNAPTLLNSASQTYWFWDGRADTLENQIAQVLTNPAEMNRGAPDIVDWLAKNSDYPERFEKVYGSKEITLDNVSDAIAKFISTIRSGRSQFDVFVRTGKTSSLSDSALRGLHIFRTDAKCMNCHNGPNFTDNQFHDIGLSYYGRKLQDLGRYNVTKDPKDVGAFKTPTLRNITRTSPYMHVGLFELDGVLNLYNVGMPTLRPKAGQFTDPLFPKKSPLLHPLGLNKQDFADLKAFLQTLEEPKQRIRPPEDLIEQLKTSESSAGTPTTIPATQPVAAKPAVTFPAPKPGEWFPGLATPPAINPKLPDAFTIVTLDSNGQWNMKQGVLWALPATAKPFEQGQSTAFSETAAPLFLVRISSDIAQLPGTKTFSHEKSVENLFTRTGTKDLKVQKFTWGSHPVLAVTGKRPNGAPIHLAWIGLNSPDGWTLLVDYKTPKGEGHPTSEETKIWEDFLTQSTAPAQPATLPAK